MQHNNWNGFVSGKWNDEINVSNFILLNLGSLYAAGSVVGRATGS